MTVGNQSRPQIHAEIGRTPVARVFHLCNMREWVVDRLDEGAPSAPQLVSEPQEFVLHVGPEPGDQLEAPRLGTVAFVPAASSR